MSTATTGPENRQTPHNPYADQQPKHQVDNEEREKGNAVFLGACLLAGLLGLILGELTSCTASGEGDMPETTVTVTATTTVTATPDQALASDTANDPVETPDAVPATAAPEPPAAVAQGTAPVGDVPREHENALQKANNYLRIKGFSHAGLYEQLTSEHGENFPADAADYAMANVNADWNAEALEAARSYQRISPMSDDRLFEQLTSPYGENFTPEQARYAIDNL